MAEPFDLEELVHLEQTFYDAGYTDGFAHGRIHGLIQGRALGREKGFEIWEEIGFYEGFARTWRAVYTSRGPQNDQRAMHHITRLLDLIGQFPTVNPSQTEPETEAEMEAEGHPPCTSSEPIDLSKLQAQIRSRYKALCVSLGVRPLRAGGEVPGEGPKMKNASHVWPLEEDGRHPTTQGLSF